MRSLTLRQRRELLCLTAASGSIPNLLTAITSAGLVLTRHELEAAAAAGHLEVCRWLLLQGCPIGDALSRAAGNDQRHVCDWLLLRSGCSQTGDAVLAALRGGFVGLAESLLSKGVLAPPSAAFSSGFTGDIRDVRVVAANDGAMLAAAAEGCDLATLQRLHRTWGVEPPAATPSTSAVTAAGRCGRRVNDDAVAAAAGSCTPDWREKVEWLGTRGWRRRRSAAACAAAAARPDAVDRLTWLRQRGFPADATATLAAAAAGDAAALQYLFATGVPVHGEAAEVAAAAGHVHVLDVLWREAAAAVKPWFVASAGAGGAHVPVLAWLAERYGAAAPGLRCPHVFACGARSGSVELMAWLRERGCPWDAAAVTGAADGGCEAALEWLAERGCPMPDTGEPYVRAARNGDLATLRALRRLGCPWGPAGEVFTRCVCEDGEGGCALPVLAWLLEAGCTVDWGAAVKMARRRRRRGDGDGAAVLSWLKGQTQQARTAA